MKEYLFKSSRLGFRNWTPADLDPMAGISGSDEVMEFFPRPATFEETNNFIARMKRQMAENGFCYFAVDKLEDASFIGFIGLMLQDYKADFTPCIDIGWRLDLIAWNKGYATEGALACLDYGFNNLNLVSIYSTAPVVNVKSEAIMKRIGMRKIKEFDHPRLLDDDRLRCCNLYLMTKDMYQALG